MRGVNAPFAKVERHLDDDFLYWSVIHVSIYTSKQRLIGDIDEYTAVNTDTIQITYNLLRIHLKQRCTV
jgi:hypothetical protein